MRYFDVNTAGDVRIYEVLDRLELNDTGRPCDRRYELVPDFTAYALAEYRHPQRVSLPTMGGR